MLLDGVRLPIQGKYHLANRKILKVIPAKIQDLLGNGYSVLLAVCSAICPASFWSRSANLYGAEHFGE